MPISTFEVVVRGRLSPALLAALGDFSDTRYDAGLTHLIGHVPDQDCLHRIFRQLCDLNIELVSVNPVHAGSIGTPQGPLDKVASSRLAEPSVDDA